jgi:hypothetical protein
LVGYLDVVADNDVLIVPSDSPIDGATVETVVLRANGIAVARGCITGRVGGAAAGIASRYHDACDTACAVIVEAINPSDRH